MENCLSVGLRVEATNGILYIILYNDILDTYASSKDKLKEWSEWCLIVMVGSMWMSCVWIHRLHWIMLSDYILRSYVSCLQSLAATGCHRAPGVFTVPDAQSTSHIQWIEPSQSISSTSTGTESHKLHSARVKWLLFVFGKWLTLERTQDYQVCTIMPLQRHSQHMIHSPCSCSPLMHPASQKTHPITRGSRGLPSLDLISFDTLQHDTAPWCRYVQCQLNVKTTSHRMIYALSRS